MLRAFCKGKHIFIEFYAGTFLHNHLLMKGIWRKLEGQQLFYPETTWLGLYVGPFTICNLNGQMLKLVNDDVVKLQCSSLGPDAMAHPFPKDMIRQALSDTPLPVSEALLDQPPMSAREIVNRGSLIDGSPVIHGKICDKILNASVDQ